jgi:hypothetical protein
LQRTIFTVRRTLQVVLASIAVELALDFGAGAVAVVLAPYLGTWVYAVAGVIVIGSLPVLTLNVARVVVREWRQHRVTALQEAHGKGPLEGFSVSRGAEI